METPARTARGFTLVELLVVVVLSSGIMLLGMWSWRPQQHAILELRDRTQVVGELRLAVENLLQDLGGAHKLTISGTTLHIEREEATATLAGGWDGSADEGVEYWRDDDDLWRLDVASGRVRLVASRLTAFDVGKNGKRISIDLSAGEGDAERNLGLRWRNP